MWSTLLLLTVGSTALGQEMEPRAFSRAPVGTQFVVVSYAHQTGDVLVDSSLPLRDVTVNLNLGSVGYGRTFALAGRQANVSALVPYIAGNVAGTVEALWPWRSPYKILDHPLWRARAQPT